MLTGYYICPLLPKRLQNFAAFDTWFSKFGVSFAKLVALLEVFKFPFIIVQKSENMRFSFKIIKLQSALISLFF